MTLRRHLLLPCLVIAGVALADVTAAWAQAQPKGTPPRGQVRVQGEELQDRPTPAPAPRGAGLQDLREDMRRFVQGISAYTRNLRPDFVVLVENGLDLLVKVDVADETKVSPARAYMRAIDGVAIEGLHYGDPSPGTPTPPERASRKLQLAEYAKKNGLKVLTVDYVADAKQAEDSYRQSEAKGFVPLALETPIAEVNTLPRFLSRPYRENSNHILSFGSVRNFLAIGDPSAFGRQDEFALKMHDTNYDVIITDPFHGRLPLTAQAVETLKYKKLGAKRLVLARIDIGTAASYSWFWKPEWREGSPAWINAPLPGNPDRYYIQYWNPGWQRLMYGDNSSYIYGVLADQGFDGVLLAGIEAYRFFEGGTEQEQAGQ